MSNLLINFFHPHSPSTHIRPKIAVVIHIYYAEILDEVFNLLINISEPYDLYISICDTNLIRRIKYLSEQIACRVFIAILENKGRDVLPFLRIVSSDSFSDYACILKLHSKRSKYSNSGDKWREDLFHGLLPSKEGVTKIISSFLNDKKLGVCAPNNYFLSNDRYWGGNKSTVERMSEALSIANENVKLILIAGTMFWYAPHTLSALNKLFLNQTFEIENGQRDGTLAHAYERLVCLVALEAGYKLACTEAPSEPLDICKIASNTLNDAHL